MLSKLICFQGYRYDGGVEADYEYYLDYFWAKCELSDRISESFHASLNAFPLIVYNKREAEQKSFLHP